VFPNVPVDFRSDKYYVWDKGDFYRDDAEKRAPGTKSKRTGKRLSTDSYFAEPYSIGDEVPWQNVANADAAVQLEDMAAQTTMQKLMIREERDFATQFMAAGVWDNDYDGTTTSAGANEVIQWSDQVSGTPIEDIQFAKETILGSTGYEANVLALGYQTYSDLLNHPDIVDRIKYAGGGGPNAPAVVRDRAMAEIFGVDRIEVSRAVYNSADEDATDSIGFIVGKDALLCYVPPNPGLMVPAAGYTFAWRRYPGATNDMGIRMRRIEDEEAECTIVEGTAAWDHKVVSSALGFFWDGVVG